MWLMSEAKGVEKSLEGLARRLLLVNFAAIHTTSLVRRCTAQPLNLDPNLCMIQTSTQVLYRLLANPEYIEPLRQEIEAVIAEEGWTKAGIDKMHKLDSVVRETQRLDSLGFGLSTPLHSSLVTDTCSGSGGDPSYTAPIHILQRCDHPSGHPSSRSAQCYPYEWGNIL